MLSVLYLISHTHTSYLWSYLHFSERASLHKSDIYSIFHMHSGVCGMLITDCTYSQGDRTLCPASLIVNPWLKTWSTNVARISFKGAVLLCPFPSLTPTSHSSSTPVLLDLFLLPLHQSLLNNCFKSGVYIDCKFWLLSSGVWALHLIWVF